MTTTVPHQQEPSRPEPIIEDSLGVCGVRDDTRALAEAAAAGPAGRALDMGTGSGYVALFLAQRGWDVDAVDVSLRALEVARHNAQLNDLHVRLYASDLFDQVTGTFDVIAFNPPMRRDETELSRWVTSLLRRSPAISGLLMETIGRFFEGERHRFLAGVLEEARRHLRPGGSLLMGISEEEANVLGLLPGVQVTLVLPIPTMPRQEIYRFRLDDPDEQP